MELVIFEMRIRESDLRFASPDLPRQGTYVIAAPPFCTCSRLYFSAVSCLLSPCNARNAVIQSPGAMHRKPHQVHLVKSNPQCLIARLRPRCGQHQRKSLALQYDGRTPCFLPALLGESTSVHPVNLFSCSRDSRRGESEPIYSSL